MKKTEKENADKQDLAYYVIDSASTQTARKEVAKMKPKRGRKPGKNAVDATTDGEAPAPKKRGRKPKTQVEAEVVKEAEYVQNQPEQQPVEPQSQPDTQTPQAPEEAQNQQPQQPAENAQQQPKRKGVFIKDNNANIFGDFFSNSKRTFTPRNHQQQQHPMQMQEPIDDQFPPLDMPIVLSEPTSQNPQQNQKKQKLNKKQFQQQHQQEHLMQQFP